METKEKVNFEVDQKVFDYAFEQGTIVNIHQTTSCEKYLVVIFESNKNPINYDISGRLLILDKDGYPYVRAVNPTLATKEYYLENFTQEPQIDYTKYINSWGKFGFSKDEIEIIGVLKDFRETSEGLKYFYPFEDKNIDYEYFEPISDEEYQKYLKNIL